MRCSGTTFTTSYRNALIDNAVTKNTLLVCGVCGEGGAVVARSADGGYSFQCKSLFNTVLCKLQPEEYL